MGVGQWMVAVGQLNLAQGALGRANFINFTERPGGIMARWDNGQKWDSGLLWDSTSPLPPPSVAANHKHKHTMKRQRFFPRTIDARPDWFGNFAAQLPIANATLGLPAGEVTSIVSDALDAKYMTGLWLKAAREFGPAATSALEGYLNQDGDGATAFVPPVFTPPTRPAGVTAVPTGALNRILQMAARIKTLPAYTEAIGLQLGIVGPEDATEHEVPEFTLKLLTGEGCDCVQGNFKKFGYKGVAVYCKVNDGPEILLAIDLATPYVDARPLAAAGVAEKRTYRFRFYDDNGPVGDFTAASSVTVSPT
jgi:hypothetical protein